jgi:hypothetical protein
MFAQFVAVHAGTTTRGLSRVSLYIPSAGAIKTWRARQFLRVTTRGVQRERDRNWRSMHFFLDFISEAPYI